MPTMIEIQTEINNTFRALEYCDDDQRAQIEKAAEEHLSMLAEQEAEKIDAYAHVIREQVARVEFLKAEKKRIDDRIRVANNGLDRMKSFMLSVLNSSGIKNAKGNSSTLYIRKSESVLVETASEKLPEEFKTIKTTITANRAAIKKAIKDGESVEGCRISENQSLVVR